MFGTSHGTFPLNPLFIGTPPEVGGGGRRDCQNRRNCQGVRERQGKKIKVVSKVVSYEKKHLFWFRIPSLHYGFECKKRKTFRPNRVETAARVASQRATFLRRVGTSRRLDHAHGCGTGEAQGKSRQHHRLSRGPRRR